jgi:hypothetical protein
MLPRWRGGELKGHPRGDAPVLDRQVAQSDIGGIDVYDSLPISLELARQR